MKLIVGLGNPGPEYARTRHNAGFLALDRLARRHASPQEVAKARFAGITLEASIRGEKSVLLKPTTYMNRSGQSVVQAIGFYKLDPRADLLVLVDDAALPSGTIRVRPSGGAGGHNGLSDIERALASQEYPRLRIGIDLCPQDMLLEDYVLGRFTPEQTALLEPSLEKAADAAEAFVSEGVVAAMNRFNATGTEGGGATDQGNE